MKRTTGSRSRVRSTTPARIDEILTSAREVLVRDGYAHFNLRKVAMEVGVRLATIQHHFPTREALLTAAITKAMRDWGRRYQEIAHQSSSDPEQRLRELHQQSLDFLDSPETAPLIVECFALAQHDESIRDLVLAQYSAYRSLYRELLSEVRPDLSTETLTAFATVLIAQIEGLVLLLRQDDPNGPNRKALELAMNCQFDAFMTAFRAHRSDEAPLTARPDTGAASRRSRTARS